MGTTPILEIARAYGLRPRLWLLIIVDLFPALVQRRKQYIFVRVHVADVFPWLFFRFVKMRKCAFKWKADEKFKAWIAADPT